MTKNERLAATAMLADYVLAHKVQQVSELPADLRVLAEKLRPRRGPSERRGIGVHSNADLFSGR